jgi:integrase
MEVTQEAPSNYRKAYHGPSEKTAKPIMSKADLKTIKKDLKDHPRNLALFVLGIETAFRSGDLLSLNMGDARGFVVGDTFSLRESKTKKRRMVTINQSMFDAVQPLLKQRADFADDEPLFVGEKRGTRLTVCTLGRLVKDWCWWVGLTEPGYSAHTLRKTFGYMNRKNGAPIELLQNIYGHASARITQAYIAIQPDEIKAVYDRGVF